MAILYYPSVPVDGGTISTSADSFSICQLTSTKFLSVYRQVNPDFIIARVINYNQLNGQITGSNQWIVNGLRPRSHLIRKVDSNKALIIYHHDSLANNTISVQIVSVDPNDEIVYLTSMSTHTVVETSATRLIQVIETTTSALLVVYGVSALDIRCRRIFVSGFSVDVSNEITLMVLNNTDGGIGTIERIESSGNIIPFLTIWASASTTSVLSISASTFIINNLYNPSLNISSTLNSQATLTFATNAFNIGTGTDNATNMGNMKMDFDVINNDYIVFTYNRNIGIYKYSTPASLYLISHSFNHTQLTLTSSVTTLVKAIDNNFFFTIRLPVSNIAGQNNIVGSVFNLISNYTGLVKSTDYTFSTNVNNFNDLFISPIISIASNNNRRSVKSYKHLFKVSDQRYVYFYRITSPLSIRALTIYSPLVP